MSLLGEQQIPSIHCQGFQKDNNLINASIQGLFNNPKESEHLQTCGLSYQQEVWTTPTLNSLNHICNANVDIKYKKYKFQKSSECFNPFAPGVIPSPSHDSRDTRHSPGPISQHIPRFFPCQYPVPTSTQKDDVWGYLYLTLVHGITGTSSKKYIKKEMKKENFPQNYLMKVKISQN